MLADVVSEDCTLGSRGSTNSEWFKVTNKLPDGIRISANVADVELKYL
jgi:hypothetical protein